MDDATSRILIAEDNPAMRKVLSFNLKRAGYRVTECGSGREAFEAACANRFDLVVTDHQMPYMTGVELARRLRESAHYVTTPLILLTAKSFEFDHEELKTTLGISAVLHKPFSPSHVVQMVRDLLLEATEA